MKLSFVFEDDEVVLVNSQDNADRTLASSGCFDSGPPDGTGKVVLTREFRDEWGPREEPISFEGSEHDVLTIHLSKLLEFLRDPKKEQVD